MKTYVLSIAKTFPRYHIRAGEPTCFKEKILSGEKIHTIRGNYDLWKARVDNINSGEAILSFRQWKEIPYNSQQVEFMRLGKSSVQKICFDDWFYTCTVDGKRIDVSCSMLAENDGITESELESWFKPCDLSKPMAIIHFTQKRY